MGTVPFRSAVSMRKLSCEVCCLCNRPATARFWMSRGVRDEPDVREQSLCHQHSLRASPIGGMVQIETFDPLGGQMQVECKHCQHQLDPNSDDAPWAPPEDPDRNIGALVCPGCNNKADFTNWKSITSDKVVPQSADK